MKSNNDLVCDLCLLSLLKETCQGSLNLLLHGGIQGLGGGDDAHNLTSTIIL